jgi:hypothetical protein
MLPGNLRKKHHTNPTIHVITNASNTCTSSKKTWEPNTDQVMASCWTSVRTNKLAFRTKEMKLLQVATLTIFDSECEQEKLDYRMG